MCPVVRDARLRRSGDGDLVFGRDREGEGGSINVNERAIKEIVAEQPFGRTLVRRPHLGTREPGGDLLVVTVQSWVWGANNP